MKTLVKAYKSTISFLLEALFGKGCRYHPTCSEYFEESIDSFGLARGTVLFSKRFLRCHPFSKRNYFDPVPKGR